jgi:hypothetical protein
MLNLLCCTRSKLGSEIIQEIKDRLRSLGHLIFNDKGSMVWIAKESCSFITEDDGFSKKRDVLVALLPSVLFTPHKSENIPYSHSQ